MHDHHVMEPGGEHEPPRGEPLGEASFLGPPSCAPLSWQEHEVLDDIEHDLASNDPGLFAQMSQLDDLDLVPPLWARVGAGVAFGVMLLIFVIALPVLGGLVLLGLLAAAVFLPWVLSPPGGHVDPEART